MTICVLFTKPACSHTVYAYVGFVNKTHDVRVELVFDPHMSYFVKVPDNRQSLLYSGLKLLLTHKPSQRTSVYTIRSDG